MAHGVYMNFLYVLYVIVIHSLLNKIAAQVLEWRKKIKAQSKIKILVAISDRIYTTRKLSYRKDDRAMRPIYGSMPWKFSRVPNYAHGYFSRNFKWAFLPTDGRNLKFVALPVVEVIRDIQKIGQSHTPFLFLPKFFNGLSFGWTVAVNVPSKFEVRSKTRSWDIWRYPQKIWTVPGYPHATFSPKFCSDESVNVTAKFEVCSFVRSWDNSDWSLEWGLRAPIWEEEAVGCRGWYRSKDRWWVPIGPPR